MPPRTRRGRKRAAEIIHEVYEDENAAPDVGSSATTFDPSYVEEELKDIESKGVHVRALVQNTSPRAS